MANEANKTPRATCADNAPDSSTYIKYVIVINPSDSVAMCSLLCNWGEANVHPLVTRSVNLFCCTWTPFTPFWVGSSYNYLAIYFKHNIIYIFIQFSSFGHYIWQWHKQNHCNSDKLHMSKLPGLWFTYKMNAYHFKSLALTIPGLRIV